MPLDMTQQQQLAMANAQGRAALLQTGIRMSRIVTQDAALTLGSPTRINLYRTGITTGVLVEFTADVTLSTASVNPLAPWNLIDRIKYTDFAGVDRINTDGFGLYALNSCKHGELLGNAIAGVVSTIGDKDTDILELPTSDGANAKVYFALWVPLAVDVAHGDLRGAVPSLTNIGEHYITVTPSTAVNSATDVMAAPYVSGATFNSLTCTVTQFYIQPQSLNQEMLPLGDLTTIYEINGHLDTTAGLVTGGTLLIPYPNDRSVMSALHVLENGGALTANGADLTKIELLVNSNTTFRQMTPRTFRSMMRMMLGGDLPASVYYWDHRQQNILTALFATVQAQYNLGTINAGVSKLRAQYESVYPSGAPLAGITTNAG